MFNFPRFAAVESRLARYFLILLHLPVIGFTYAVHASGGVVAASHNMAIGVLNTGNKVVQDLMEHMVGGFQRLARDVVLVARGPAPKPAPVIALPAPTEAQASSEIGAVSAELVAAAAISAPDAQAALDPVTQQPVGS